MNKIKNLVAGLAGAIALNVLHESLKKKSPDMPRVDLLGEDALQKALHYFGTQIQNKKISTRPLWPETSSAIPSTIA